MHGPSFTHVGAEGLRARSSQGAALRPEPLSARRSDAASTLLNLGDTIADALQHQKGIKNTDQPSMPVFLLAPKLSFNSCKSNYSSSLFTSNITTGTITDQSQKQQQKKYESTCSPPA